MDKPPAPASLVQMQKSAAKNIYHQSDNVHSQIFGIIVLTAINFLN